ncbi:MAG: hypothetical protein PHT54_02655 [Candidatus Nanoarchaeia archaeon]|nr:hypothetical protein [Candidatus Nanoarchaeia archaeon]
MLGKKEMIKQGGQYKMKKLIAVLAVVLMVAVSFATANSVGTGIGVEIETEDFVPEIWMCDSRVVLDDNVEEGKVDDTELFERTQNYAFEGEQIAYDVLVMDKNGINKIEDVYMTIGSSQGVGNDIEVNCVPSTETGIDPSCNARIGEEVLGAEDFNPLVMKYYTCTLTVETQESMYGEYWVTAEVTDLDGLQNTVDENEYWFFNPTIALSVEGDLGFANVRPGTAAYSPTLLVGNDADAGSGVMLDMFITGTDFYDSSSSGAMCPTTNQLSLDSFDYYAVNGAYSTADSWGHDAEGYVDIEYGNSFSTTLYNDAEIIRGPVHLDVDDGNYFAGNILAPGAEMSLTFRLMLPEPCNGDFDTGSIYFWGEAI